MSSSLKSSRFRQKQLAAAPVAAPETPPIIIPAPVPITGITEAAAPPPSVPVSAPSTVPNVHFTQLVL